MGKIIFYSDNGGKGEVIQTCSSDIFLDERIRENDEARSVELQDIARGAMIEIFDAPDGDHMEGWCRIYIKRNVTRYVLNTFERTYQDDDVDVMYESDGHGGKLDGKVSRIRIIPGW